MILLYLCEITLLGMVLRPGAWHYGLRQGSEQKVVHVTAVDKVGESPNSGAEEGIKSFSSRGFRPSPACERVKPCAHILKKGDLGGGVNSLERSQAKAKHIDVLSKALRTLLTHLWNQNWEPDVE